MKQIQMQNVTFAYDGEPVIHDVTLSIDQNELVCIVGPNGGGKTTFLRLILGIIKPQSGTVRVFGQHPEYARREIGYVPQQTMFDQSFPVSVLDVALMGRLGGSNWGFFSKEAKGKALFALEEVGLAPLAGKPFSSLSGGQKQRVLIARALATEPRMLLLDEPTSNVDQLTTHKLYEILQRLSAKMTVIFVSHDVGVVSTIVTSVLCINNREIVVHPTSDLTGDALSTLYGGNMKLVRHDHRCAEERHSHD